MRRTEAGMRAGIAALPDGEYHEEMEMEMEIEGIAQPQTLAVTVRIEGSDVYADFTGTAAQVRRPVNCPINYTRAYVALPLKLVCDPILPNKQGTYEPLHLTVPEGTLLNPTFPAACFWRLSAGMLVSELMFRVLSRIAPDRVPADSGSMPTWQFLRQRRASERRGVRAAPARIRRDGRPAGRRRARLGELSVQRARCLHRVVGDGDAGAVRGARAHRGLGRGGITVTNRPRCGVLSGVDPLRWNLVVMKPVVCNREEVQLPVFFYRDAAWTNASVGDRTSVA